MIAGVDTDMEFDEAACAAIRPEINFVRYRSLLTEGGLLFMAPRDRNLPCATQSLLNGLEENSLRTITDNPAAPAPPLDIVGPLIRPLGVWMPQVLDPIHDWCVRELKRWVGSGCIVHLKVPRRLGSTQVLLRMLAEANANATYFVAEAPPDASVDEVRNGGAPYDTSNQLARRLVALAGSQNTELTAAMNEHGTQISYVDVVPSGPRQQHQQSRQHRIVFEPSTHLQYRLGADYPPVIVADRCVPSPMHASWRNNTQTLFLAGVPPFGASIIPTGVAVVQQRQLTAHQPVSGAFAQALGAPYDNYVFQISVYAKGVALLHEIADHLDGVDLDDTSLSE